jgi:hypothetical protein
MYGCTGKMIKINLNVTVATMETVTLHYKRSKYINLQTKTFELSFVSMFVVSSAYTMVRKHHLQKPKSD